MATDAFNPYLQVGEQFEAGLDAIAATMTPASTVDDLVKVVYTYVQTIYYPSPVPKAIEVELKSTCLHVINGFNNFLLNKAKVEVYSPAQNYYVDLLTGPQMTVNTPIKSLGRWVKDVEDNVAKSTLTEDEKRPIYLATVIGRTAFAYWNSKVNTPGTWNPFFDGNKAINYANIPFWVESAIEGALIGANSSKLGYIAQTTDAVSNEIISALIGALAVCGGKVIFDWIPRIQEPSSNPKISIESIGQLDGMSGISNAAARSNNICFSSRNGWLCICASTEGPTCNTMWTVKCCGLTN